MPIKTELNVELIINEYLSGAGLQAIAKKHKTSWYIIRQILIDNEIVIRTPSSSCAAERFMLDETSIIADYINGMRSDEITKKHKTSWHRIKEILTKNNIELRHKETEIQRCARKKLEFNRELIISDYINGMPAYKIADKYKVNFKNIKLLLVENKIEIRTRHSKQLKYKYIKRALRFDVPLEWLMQFQNIEKLKFLNKQIMERGDNRFNENADWYQSYIEKFYFDKDFNRLYEQYLESGKNAYKKPSLDHIVPRSKGGTNAIDNIRFVSFLENMSKRDLSLEEWENVKSKLDYYFSQYMNEKSSSPTNKDIPLIAEEMPRKTLVRYLNMQAHIRFDVELEWLLQFRDFNKLQYLNLAISKRSTRFDETTEWYKAYVEKFYYDENFNILYKEFIKTNDKLIAPSLDHILPRANGGTNDLDNLRFLSYIENFCRRNIDDIVWQQIKANIHEYYDFNYIDTAMAENEEKINERTT